MAALRNVVNLLPKTLLKPELFPKHAIFGTQECVHFLSYTSVPYSKYIFHSLIFLQRNPF